MAIAGFGAGADKTKALLAAQGTTMKEKYEKPTFQMKPKDANLLPEEMLEVDSKQLRAAKAGEVMRPITIRFIEDGPNHTLDQFTTFKKDVKIEGMSAQQTVLELRMRIAEQENLEFEDTRLYIFPHELPDDSRIGACYFEWQGYSLDDWPPKCVCKPRVRGFEVHIKIEPSRDTAVFDKGRCHNYMARTMTFDVETSTKVAELKAMIAKHIKIPASRQSLSAQLKSSAVRNNDPDNGVMVPLDDDKLTMADYNIDKYCIGMRLEKNMFDEDGNYVFDDAYMDSEGYHAQPEDCWIAPESLNDRWRPGVGTIDVNQPMSIVTDRRQKEAAEAAEAPAEDGDKPNVWGGKV
eukprot:gnl/TRDRNA2_/TRDRNA2_180353_c0_seq1.p1 gnl/TRDRNA2_/TRDRNA2_180353_c0~~gnl/TRDRNA2_/TRDRNA2_180353_c0_seq1.p1  ORF type:complete len:350 (-),score=99.07 gnl/TRDRNA2_/TRDRNA2_180353_c0_seq1:79-1128(-)